VVLLQFYQFKEIEEKLEISYFFANPYCSWKRGTNENAKGLIGQFFPKKTDFANVSDEELAKSIALINNRPRKCLNWKTAKEVYKNNLPIPKKNKLKSIYKIIKKLVGLISY